MKEELDSGRADVLHGEGLQHVSVQYVQDAALLQAVKPCGNHESNDLLS